MDSVEQFRHEAHKLVDWMADFHAHIEDYPVKSVISPGWVIDRLPLSPPEKPESIDLIFSDFTNTILPGISHWQSPNFFAYFPANASLPSLLGEMLTAALGAQCMKWETSPAATELEERMMEWLRQMTGLPDTFRGVIQDSASTATLCAILSARERKTGANSNEAGLNQQPDLRVYCSTEAHSSVEKAVKIAGIGRKNLVKVPVDSHFAMRADLLEQAILSDLEKGMIPCCVVAAIGTTGSTAIDPLESIGPLCTKFGIWLHVDAAFAGSALILEECRHMVNGVERADSFVFNPHKWLFTHFDCSALFVKDVEWLTQTFTLVPEYLKSGAAQSVNDYSNWGIQLGRRFRALKLWYVIRAFGVEGLREKVRYHLKLAQLLKDKIDCNPHFERMAPVSLNLVCFRYIPTGIDDAAELDRFNEQLLKLLNASGKMYLSHTRLNDRYVLRMVTGQTNTTERHVLEAWESIESEAQKLALTQQTDSWV